VLVSWLLARRLGVAVPPPVSALIARDPGGYLSGLSQFRDGSLDAYVGWFADVVARAGDASVALGRRIGRLLDDWEDRVEGLRVDAAARRLLPVLPEVPVLNAVIVAQRLDVSERAARDALGALEERGIMAPVDRSAIAAAPTTGRPRTWWHAPELLEVIASWPS
jgi:hypothetical protein